MAKTEEQFRKVVAKRIAKAQRLASKSDQQIMDDLKISYTEQRMYRSGARVPSFYRVVQLADYLNVSLDYLIGKTDVPFPVV